MTDKIDKAHKGRFSGSNLGCEMQMALKKMGYTYKVSKQLQKIFDIGQEHDAVMKEEAEEEFDDFEAPEDSTIFKFKKGDTEAEVSLTPDGLRKDELIEFKGLSVNNFNSIRTEEDLRSATEGLLKKYYNQTQIYAGAFKKKNIRLRLKNKKNLKVKDICYPADPKIYKMLKNKIIKVQAALDMGELPTEDCSKRERKWCGYASICKKVKAEKFENRPQKKFTDLRKKNLFVLAKSHCELSKQIKALETTKEEVAVKIKAMMNSHGQREIVSDEHFIKYGIRYKTYKDKDMIDKLVEKGKIKVEEVPEEFLTITEEN